jgi:two-component system chemotaxis response regulator CheB
MASRTSTELTRVVALGASAGGVEALTALFRLLPRKVDAAFFVVLHIPAHSHSQLADILRAETRMQVATASDGERIRPGHVYVAQADFHLMVGDGVVRLTRGPRECRVRPAVDVLFRSTALHYGPRAIGVVLSGALDDGSAGLWSIKDRNGTALVQDPADARFPSMPESALRHVTPDVVGTIPQLAAEIERLTRQTGAGTPPSTPPERLTLESLIAGEGNALRHGVFKLGQPSRYSCPECHGVLVQIEEGSIVRFRCHTGHAYSLQTLVAGINDSIDAGLWATVRALEERLLLLRQIGELARRHGTAAEVQGYETQARYVESRIDAVRELVLDSELFGKVALAS